VARKPKNVETGLVARKVVDAEFDEMDAGKSAMADALETLATQNIQLVKLLTVNYEAMIEEKKALAGVVNESLKQQVELTKAQQELLDKKAERKVKHDREKAQAEFLQQVAGDARALLPVLVNKFGKAPMLSQSEAATIRPFIESMSQDQIAKHMSLMTPAQQAVFIQILQAIPDEPRGEMKKPDGGSNGAH
jgi:hypothetical protein